MNDRRIREFLRGTDIRGATVLEVGAGRGDLSRYTAQNGAAWVTALDPYEGRGSPPESIEAAIRDTPTNMEVVRANCLDWEPQRKYHYVFMIDALHHIVQTDRLLTKPPMNGDELLAREVFQRVRRAAPDGKLIVQDVSNRNWCPFPRYRRKMHNIRWNLKQPWWEWTTAMAAVGMSHISIRYRYPLNLPEIPGLRPLLANRLTYLFMDSSYVIEART